MPRTAVIRADNELEDTLLWQIKALRLPVPEREYRFWPGRRFRFDFAWLSGKVAVEVEGGSWVGGRHVQPSGFENDCVKYSEAAVRGWRVIRVTGDMVHDGRAVELVRRALSEEDT